MTKPRRRFADALVGAPGGFVAIFDIADCKRRNLYLGHDAVDREIEELDRRLRARVAPGFTERIAGERWAALVPTVTIDSLDDVVIGFREERVIHAGWECVARSGDGERRHERVMRPATLRRALRCAYADAGQAVMSDEAWDALQTAAVMARVSEPLFVSDLAGHSPVEREPWVCIDIDGVEDHPCPFCRGTAFDWSGGTADAAEGRCRACGAEVDFTISTARSEG